MSRGGALVPRGGTSVSRGGALMPRGGAPVSRCPEGVLRHPLLLADARSRRPTTSSTAEGELELRPLSRILLC
jgi:hypothetical protein